MPLKLQYRIKQSLAELKAWLNYTADFST
jgi:hypothetical protein